MRNRRAERALPRFVGIGVNPLRIQRGLRERVDARLFDDKPFGHGQFLADEIGQLTRAIERLRVSMRAALSRLTGP